MFRVISEGAAFREHVLLRNGRGVLIRAGTPEDLPLVEELVARVSPDSLRLRFGGAVREVPREVLVRLTRGDFTREGCLLAIVREDGTTRVVGKGNYIGLENGRSAEFAILVEDSCQGLGISTLLLERLAGLAAANDFTELVAEVLTENETMLRVLRSSGLELRQTHGGGAVQVVVPITNDATVREAARVREQVAVAASLEAVFRPASIAVVGISASRSSPANRILHNLIASGFTGKLYAVGAHAMSLENLPVHRTLGDLPGVPDLAVIAVPSEAVLEVEETAARSGVKALVVVTTGFADAGPEGAVLQRRLAGRTRAHGLRLVGPSSLGVINTDPDVSLNASLAQAMPPAGGLGFFSHSGALGLSMLEYAGSRGLGFSTFVAAGNRADVHVSDLLLYWEEDPRTTIAALYLESFGDPRRFTRVARHMTPRKPVLCVKSARSLAGRAAARQHSGASPAPCSDLDEETLFQQAGVIRTNDLKELVDVAILLENQPLPRGDSVAIITNSGGLGTLCADACQAHGLCLADSGLVHVAITQPPGKLRPPFEAALTGVGVDAVVGAFACLGEWTPSAIAGQVRAATARRGQTHDTVVPVALCLVGATAMPEARSGNELDLTIPVYRFPESAVQALAHAARYAAFKRRQAGTVRWHDDIDVIAARHRIHELLEDHPRAGAFSLDADDAAALLSAFRIAVKDAPSLGVSIAVRSDPLFGPLIELRHGTRSPVFRLTPLTDRDIAESVDAAGCTTYANLGELLSRLSQLIEELPWVRSLQAKPGSSAEPVLLPGVRIEIALAPPHQ